MNREILFRGKRMDNGEWSYGFILHAQNDDSWCITNEVEYLHDVDGNTVGQYTGLTDKNGVKIFEGDIISYSGSKEVVRFNTSLNIPCFTTGIGGGSSTRLHPYKISKKHVVIGNIHDDPELLEVRDETL